MQSALYSTREQYGDFRILLDTGTKTKSYCLHRVVLTAVSPFFERLITRGKNYFLYIMRVDEEPHFHIFDLLVKWIYLSDHDTFKNLSHEDLLVLNRFIFKFEMNPLKIKSGPKLGRHVRLKKKKYLTRAHAAPVSSRTRKKKKKRALFGISY